MIRVVGITSAVIVGILLSGAAMAENAGTSGGAGTGGGPGLSGKPSTGATGKSYTEDGGIIAQEPVAGGGNRSGSRLNKLDGLTDSGVSQAD